MRRDGAVTLNSGALMNRRASPRCFYDISATSEPAYLVPAAQ
jgi:hypothetical protein